jgi:hypothetical protein
MVDLPVRIASVAEEPAWTLANACEYGSCRFAVFFCRLVVFPLRVIKMDRKLVHDYGRGVTEVVLFSRNSTAT